MLEHKRKKENKVLFYGLSFTWGILMTLVGLIVLAFVKVFHRKQTQVAIIRGRIVIIYWNKNFGGVSLGIVVVVDSLDDNLVSHEIGHTIQNTWFGPLFILLVAIPSVIRYHMWDRLTDKHYKKHGFFKDYDDIWFEAQATYLGGIYK